MTITPDQDAVDELRNAWTWRLERRWPSRREAVVWSPLLFSAFGDVFFERESKGVFWLDTAIGRLRKVAANRQDFEAKLKTSIVDDWFMIALLERLLKAGKVLGPGQCYSFTIFPIFAEGSYELDNIYMVPARYHFGMSGHVHQSIADLPDRAKVEIKVIP